MKHKEVHLHNSIVMLRRSGFYIASQRTCPSSYSGQWSVCQLRIDIASGLDATVESTTRMHLLVLYEHASQSMSFGHALCAQLSAAVYFEIPPLQLLNYMFFAGMTPIATLTYTGTQIHKSSHRTFSEIRYHSSKHTEVIDCHEKRQPILRECQ
eukprot:396386-Pleurochrysis_carterae.AAC.1